MSKFCGGCDVGGVSLSLVENGVCYCDRCLEEVVNVFGLKVVNDKYYVSGGVEGQSVECSPERFCSVSSTFKYKKEEK
ncbi:MAG TPA: hypothetical protein PLT65_04295 [Bacilli bacterium]|nr:hypothetical protein [Bacilli bacterium]